MTALNTAVALFIFNRPETTREVFQAISVARPSKLLLIADGPRDEAEAELCERTREIVNEVNWPCEVITNFSEKNMGCKWRISSGLSWVFELVEEVIILEDDCLPHSDFFYYCQMLLDKYRDDDRVMMISGDNFLPESTDIEEDYFFSRYFSIWGWATWRRAWRKYDINMAAWPDFRNQGQLRNLQFHEGVRKFIESIFNETYAGKINTWAVQWFFACLFNYGLSVVPRRNLVSNIGTTGTHAAGQNRNHLIPAFGLDSDHIKHPTYVFPNILYEGPYFDSRFAYSSKPLRLRALSRLRRIFRIRSNEENN